MLPVAVGGEGGGVEDGAGGSCNTSVKKCEGERGGGVGATEGKWAMSVRKLEGSEIQCYKKGLK